MSNELTIPEVDDGWGDAAAEASDRVLQGHLLKFTDGTWTYGQLATIVPESLRLIAHAVAAAWVRWEGGKPVQYEMHKGAIWVDRDQLGYDDESKWENGPDGKPRDPWQKTKFVYLSEPTSVEVYTFTTSSASGLGAISDLANTIARKRFSGRKVLPLVQLDRAPMKTKFGMKRKPVFKIVDWLLPDGSRDAPAIQPKQIEHNPAKVAAHGDMDDEIPF